MRHRGAIAVIACAVVLVCGLAPAAARAGGYHVTQVWGEAGDGRGQLQVPKGVAVAPDGSVWVVDYSNETMLKYAASGELLGCWGGLGRGPGEFRRPSRVAIGRDGTVYVTDAANQRIQCFSQSGRFIGEWGRAGTGPGEFSYPRGIGVGPDGSVYVTDQANHRVQVFTASGQYLRQWGSKGDGRGRFRIPKDVAVSSDGRVYVVDAGTDRVQIFSTQGKWLGWFGGEGSAPGRLSGPRGLGVDTRGHVFVADAMNHRIQEFTAVGQFVREWGCEGSLAGLFQAPRDIAQAPDGSMVVADTYNHRLQRFVEDDSADDTAPVTACDASAGWSASPLDVLLAATDDAGGVAATYVSVDGSRFHLVDGPVALETQGRHVLRYLSVDAAGNQEALRSRRFLLDWGVPRARFRPRLRLMATAGSRVSSFCTVVDEYSPTCSVWIRLDRDDESVWHRALGRVPASPTGRMLKASFRAPRAAGRYDLIVTTRDLAGNTGSRGIDLIVSAR